MDSILTASVKDKRETQDLRRVTVTLGDETLPADSDSDSDSDKPILRA